jgi:hypothetical protein
MLTLVANDKTKFSSIGISAWVGEPLRGACVRVFFSSSSSDERAALARNARSVRPLPDREFGGKISHVLRIRRRGTEGGDSLGRSPPAHKGREQICGFPIDGFAIRKRFEQIDRTDSSSRQGLLCRCLAPDLRPSPSRRAPLSVEVGLVARPDIAHGRRKEDAKSNVRKCRDFFFFLFPVPTSASGNLKVAPRAVVPFWQETKQFSMPAFRGMSYLGGVP